MPVPSYELEVNEEGGAVSRKIMSSDAGYGVGDVFEDEGRALRVWRIEEADPPKTARLVCGLSWDASVQEVEDDEEVEIAIDITPEATERILSKGGSLYLWEKPLGSWLEDKASFSCPNDAAIEFDEFDIDGIQIFIASEVEPPQQLTIEHLRLSRIGLRIVWDGQIWGQRGTVTGYQDMARGGPP